MTLPVHRVAPSHARLGPLGLGLLAVLGLAGSSSGQTSPLAETRVDFALDSGFAANTAGEAQTVIAFHVEVPGAPWVRLFFGDVQLSGDAARGTGSVLQITSLLDGYHQTLNARTLAEWRQSSAYFNGDLLLVEVIAQPGTGENRVVVDHAFAGLLPPPPSASRSICGSDDRLPSSDVREARLLPVGCTGFIINDACNCMATAGHCIGATNVVQFNVPLSNSNGSLNNPPPEDQYSVDFASRQWISGGLGNDWAYYGVFPNSNTGLTPFEAQGQRFTFAPPPAFNPAHDIRITGYGVDSGNRNQVQQTEVGPWDSITGTVLRYVTDTEGGNSGSPVIHELSGSAIGIHTNGGCGTTGGSNSGTARSNANLQNALNNPQGVCRKTTCPIPPTAVVRNGSGTNPVCLQSLNLPAIGTTFQLRVSTAGAPGANLTLLQCRRSPLAGLQLAFGELLIDIESNLLRGSVVAPSGGAAVHNVAIPPDVGLAGSTVYFQGGVQTSGTWNHLCNAIDATLGCETP